MKLTAKGHCALKAMLVLAVHEPKRLSVKMIAEKQNLSPRYLEQVFSMLKNNQLIEGIKGPSGGYTLLKSPKDISLNEIICAVEGHHPFGQTKESDIIGEVIDNVLGDLDQHIEEYLKGKSLSDLSATYKEKTHEGYMYFI